MEKILMDLAVQENFSEKAKIEIMGSGLQERSNFHGSIFRARISENGRALSVVIKKEIQDEGTNNNRKFSNEIHFYTKIYPQLRAFGDVPKVPRYLWHGKLDEAAIIIIEDLSVEGFEPARSGTVLDEKEVELVLGELQKLHESSMKMKEQNLGLFELLAARLEESFCSAPLYEVLLPRLFENAMLAADKYLPEKYKDKLARFDYSRTKEWAMKGCEGDVVLTHGDSWYSNFLFKYQGDTPVSVVILDWQMCRLASPLLDVSQLLFTSTSGTRCPSAPECAFGFIMAILILPFSLGQADSSLIVTPEKLVIPDNVMVMKRIASIVKVVVDKGIV